MFAGIHRERGCDTRFDLNQKRARSKRAFAEARLLRLLMKHAYFVRVSDNAPGAIPTRDLTLRRRSLYATELREQTRAAKSLAQCFTLDT